MSLFRKISSASCPNLDHFQVDNILMDNYGDLNIWGYLPPEKHRGFSLVEEDENTKRLLGMLDVYWFGHIETNSLGIRYVKLHARFDHPGWQLAIEVEDTLPAPYAEIDSQSVFSNAHRMFMRRGIWMGATTIEIYSTYSFMIDLTWPTNQIATNNSANLTDLVITDWDITRHSCYLTLTINTRQRGYERMIVPDWEPTVVDGTISKSIF